MSQRVMDEVNNVLLGLAEKYDDAESLDPIDRMFMRALSALGMLYNFVDTVPFKAACWALDKLAAPVADKLGDGDPRYQRRDE